MAIFKGTLRKISNVPGVLKNEGVRGILVRLLDLWRVSYDGWIKRHGSYVKWIQLYDTLTEESRVLLLGKMSAWKSQPLFSIILPTYNSNPKWLMEAIESVRRQLYENWELCIADDASQDDTTRAILKHYSGIDKRVKVVYRSQNGHISAASNSALELASGDWVVLLDHDDVLSVQALYRLAEVLNTEANLFLIYSDEDRIDEYGRRSNPYFKCDWNSDLFHSYNMVSHMGAYRMSMVRQLKGFRVGMEGAQDYDLALRFTEKINPDQIRHIPRVLYHWREHAGSVALSASAKPYALPAGERALNEHFQREQIHAVAELTSCGYRVRYSLPPIHPLISLIIPTKNEYILLRKCIESIKKKTVYKNYEILIIDNGSEELDALNYLESLGNDPCVRVIRAPGPFNYSALNNGAVRLAKGTLVGLLNNDIEVISPDWLTEMISIAMQPQVGAVGAKLLYPNGSLQHAGVVLGIGGCAGHAHKHLPGRRLGYASRAALIQGFSAVTGACLVVRKEIYESLGGLNEIDLKVAFNDVDFCLRVREAGYRNVWTPYALLYHHESATRGMENTPEKKARFDQEFSYMKKRWGDLLLNDPAYNPNLTLEREDFSLAWPPRYCANEACSLVEAH